MLFVRLIPKVPGAIEVLFGSTAAVMLFHLPVATIGSGFGGIPAGLPAAHIPSFQPHLFWTLLGPATTVAMLGAIESLFSSVVADGMNGGERHNSNTELFGQGIANIVSPSLAASPPREPSPGRRRISVPAAKRQSPAWSTR